MLRGVLCLFHIVVEMNVMGKQKRKKNGTCAIKFLWTILATTVYSFYWSAYVMGGQMNCSRMMVNTRKTIDSFSFRPPDKHNTTGWSHNNATQPYKNAEMVVQSCQWRRLPNRCCCCCWCCLLLRWIDVCFYYSSTLTSLLMVKPHCQRITIRETVRLFEELSKINTNTNTNERGEQTNKRWIPNSNARTLKSGSIVPLLNLLLGFSSFCRNIASGPEIE